VRFKNKPDADALLELSQKVESQLDKDRAFDRVQKVGVDNKKKKVDDITEQIMGTGSLLKGELELKGRRLVVMPSVKREKVTEVLQNNLLNKSKEGGGQFDKRNMYLRKEGLLNEGLWIHQKPALTSKELEQRQRLYMEKDKALKANPNLSVADKRV